MMPMLFMVIPIVFSVNLELKMRMEMINLEKML